MQSECNATTSEQIFFKAQKLAEMLSTKGAFLINTTRDKSLMFAGSAFGASNVICMHEELESPFDSFRPPDE